MQLTRALLPTRELPARLFAIALLAMLVVFLARTYVGHSSSPYGACYARSGRSIPCAVAVTGRSTHHSPNQR